MKKNKLLSILRNPYGFCEDDRIKARLIAADIIDEIIIPECPKCKNVDNWKASSTLQGGIYVCRNCNHRWEQ